MTLSQQAPSLVERLKEGCIYRAGGDGLDYVDENKTDALCAEAAARITELETRLEGARAGEPTEAMLAAGAAELCRLSDHPDDLDIVRCIYVVMQALYTSHAEPSGWRPMESAPKDGTYILARVAPQDDDDRWGYLSGRCFVIRHEERTPSGYDLGWSVFPGFGGVSDDWFEGWLPLPPTSEGGGA